jgi:hypothetical protein
MEKTLMQKQGGELSWKLKAKQVTKCCLKAAWMQKQGKQGVNFGARGEDFDAKARG